MRGKTPTLGRELARPDPPSMRPPQNAGENKQVGRAAAMAAALQ